MRKRKSQHYKVTLKNAAEAVAEIIQEAVEQFCQTIYDGLEAVAPQMEGGVARVDDWEVGINGEM